MQVSGLGKVSHDKQQQSMNPSLLSVVDAIKAILMERHQSTRNMNASNATRNKATTTNSVLKLQGGLADKQDKNIMRAL